MSKTFPGIVKCHECGVELSGLQKNAGRCHPCIKRLFPMLFNTCEEVSNAEALAAFREANGMNPDTIGMFTCYGAELARFAEYWRDKGSASAPSGSAESVCRCPAGQTTGWTTWGGIPLCNVCGLVNAEAALEMGQAALAEKGE